MAFGGIGGAITELILTCQTPTIGVVRITRGDAVRLVGSYTVDNKAGILFGQAMADSNTNGQVIPIKVRGVAIFEYQESDPVVDGQQGVCCDDLGFVANKYWSIRNINLKVDKEKREVHVLL